MCVQMQANTQINKRSQYIGLIIITMAERFWSAFMLMIRIRKYSASYGSLIFNSAAFQDYSRIIHHAEQYLFCYDVTKFNVPKRSILYVLYISTLLIY